MVSKLLALEKQLSQLIKDLKDWKDLERIENPFSEQ